MEDYLNALNDSQREAVLYDGGPSLVVAGAGSGKTRVLTCKVAHLLQSGYQPHTILALTFTNKAAREMKQRIASIMNDHMTRYLWMGTFHSIFYRILRREASRLGFPSDFTIYDSADSKNLIKTIIKEMQLDDKTYRPGMIQSRISNAKNALVTCNAYDQNHDLLSYDSLSKVPRTNEIYRRYQNRCFNAGVMDFDELLLQTNILFRDHPDVLAKYQEQFRYVLVDEYQDTNFAQHLIVARLCNKHRHIFVVGDDAQSIYSFRGANIDNMLRFKDNYPACKVFKLEQNYRSTQNIVDAANSLIAQNKEQIKKTVYSKNEKGSRVSVLSSYSDYEEAYLVSAKIPDMMAKKGYSYADFAILYRTNAQSRVLEEAMRKHALKYKIYGAQSFYQRKEIKDVIAYFRAVINPSDEESVKRIINYPARGIGDTTVDRLQNAALSAGTSLWEVIASPLEYAVAVSKGTAAKLQDFRLLIEDFQARNKTAPANETAEYIIKRSSIAGILFQDTSIEGISRQENVQELLNAVGEFVSIRQEEGSENTSLTDFLMEVSLMTDQDNEKDENTDRVTLMTVHAAKGLEFKNVFIVGMENELFPSLRAMDNPRAIEEERRLFYVALTRAKENCMITYSKNRYRNGQSNTATPSFFIKDIDRKYLDFQDEDETGPPVRSGRPYSSLSPGHDEKWNRTYGRNPAWDADMMPRRNTSGKSRPDVTSVKNVHQQSEAPIKVNTLGGLTVGNRVLHNRFGEGEVIALEGTGGNASATVKFKNSGEKRLLLKYAVLTVCK
ncbi:MAG: UvrD-helicase domain-containing protein [Tannerella sp.]|jgi:DNA helicase-2/ATP-dependent DNA helicase PcrA|nr:UvrD-helicase domain-containing protein [Tannerella sp.]